MSKSFHFLTGKKARNDGHGVSGLSLLDNLVSLQVVAVRYNDELGYKRFLGKVGLPIWIEWLS